MPSGLQGRLHQPKFSGGHRFCPVSPRRQPRPAFTRSSQNLARKSVGQRKKKFIQNGSRWSDVRTKRVTCDPRSGGPWHGTGLGHWTAGGAPCVEDAEDPGGCGELRRAGPRPVRDARRGARVGIPPPIRFPPSDPGVRRVGLAAPPATGTHDPTTAPALPTAAPLPQGSGAQDTAARANAAAPAATPPPPPHLPVDSALIPGRTVEPIDLANALKLAGVNQLDIATARQRILQAAADLSQARALWLPSLFYGPSR